MDFKKMRTRVLFFVALMTPSLRTPSIPSFSIDLHSSLSRTPLLSLQRSISLTPSLAGNSRFHGSFCSISAICSISGRFLHRFMFLVDFFIDLCFCSISSSIYVSVFLILVRFIKFYGWGC